MDNLLLLVIIAIKSWEINKRKLFNIVLVLMCFLNYLLGKRTFPSLSQNADIGTTSL